MVVFTIFHRHVAVHTGRRVPNADAGRGGFGILAFAAPGLSVVGSAIVFGLVMLWLAYRERTLKAAGHSFSDPTHDETTGRMDPADLSVKWKAAQDQQPAATASRGVAWSRCGPSSPWWPSTR